MDFNIQLIELVKGCKFLYDSSDPNYGDSASRKKVWKEIAGKLKVPESECKKAWILLREGYRRVIKKQLALKNDPAKNDKTVMKWTYEDDMAFMAQHLKIRSLTLGCQYNDISIEDNSDSADSQMKPEVAAQKPSRTKRSRTKEAARKSCANETYSNTLIKYILDKTTKRDDVQHFFESISSTVQSFPPRDRAIAKARVFAVISQMELEILGREATPSIQYDSSLASKSQNDIFVTPPPEATSPILLESSNISDDEEQPVLEIKIEPEHDWI